MPPRVISLFSDLLKLTDYTLTWYYLYVIASCHFFLEYYFLCLKKCFIYYLSIFVLFSFYIHTDRENKPITFIKNTWWGKEHLLIASLISSYCFYPRGDCYPDVCDNYSLFFWTAFPLRKIFTNKLLSIHKYKHIT